MDQDFAGRHVVVTGGTGELGSAVVTLLTSRGATCHVPTRSGGPPPGWRAHTDRARLVSGVDLTDERSVAAFYRDLPDLWASIQCAGAFTFAALRQTSLGDLETMLRANFVSCFLCCREAARKWLATDEAKGAALDRGRIVNVAARPGVDPRQGVGMGAYASSKAAVAALTVALGEELAAQGIWVNAVAPAILDTPANRASMPEADFSKWVRPAEAAEVVAFLASPKNACARGAVVPVYGRG